MNRLVAVEGFEWEKLPFFRLVRQILQAKSGIFGEKFNTTSRQKGLFIARGFHCNKSNIPNIRAAFYRIFSGIMATFDQSHCCRRPACRPLGKFYKVDENV